MKTLNILKLVAVMAGCSLIPVSTALAIPFGINIGIGAPVYPNTPPPAPIYQPEPPSPGPDYVWIPGSWAWVGNNWQWQAGQWERPPHRGMHYVPHRYYTGHDGRHVYVHGGWK